MNALPNESENPSKTETGRRFEFGKNWQRFLLKLNEERILEAERSIRNMLKIENLENRTFIDIGCGSGLFSLAAVRMGASRVLSFDYDSHSVACARELKERFYPQASHWTVEQGSALDDAYLKSLGQWDVVYSWGVLHHTGAMWKALANTLEVVRPGGKFFVSIYNDQGFTSKIWTAVKRLYNRLPAGLRFLVVAPSFVRLWGPTLVKDLFRGHPLRTWQVYVKKRGMSPWDDVIDWVGGYPFEVAKPEEIFRFCRDRGFQLTELFTTHSSACNEFVFIRSSLSELNG